MKELALLFFCTDGEAITAEKKKYQGITGSIIFLIIETKPDIIFTTSVIAQFMKNPCHQYTKVVKRSLQYLKSLRE